MTQNMSLFWKIFSLGISVIPVCLFTNRFLKSLVAQGFPSVIMLLATVVILGIYLAIVIFTCKCSSSKVKINNWHFYAFSLFSITGVVGIGIALEENGYITGFITEYLKSGEPYLFSPFGAVVSYYDGIVNYSLYFYMIYAISNNKSYRNVGIYWSGGLTFTMTALLLGIFWGKHGLLPASYINVVYLIVPVVIGWQLLQQRPALHEVSKSSRLRLHQRPFDVLLVMLLSIAAFMAILRGAAVLENNIRMAKYYTDKIEPIILLDDPAPFIRTQGQFSAITTALHSGIPMQFRVPQTQEAQTVFWFVNLLLLVLPHLLLVRCYVAGHLSRHQSSQTTKLIGKPKLK